MLKYPRIAPGHTGAKATIPLQRNRLVVLRVRLLHLYLGITHVQRIRHDHAVDTQPTQSLEDIPEIVFHADSCDDRRLAVLRMRTSESLDTATRNACPATEPERDPNGTGLSFRKALSIGSGGAAQSNGGIGSAPAAGMRQTMITPPMPSASQRINVAGRREEGTGMSR